MLLDGRGRMPSPNTLSVMPDERAASEAARRKKAAARRTPTSGAKTPDAPGATRRISVVKVAGWVAYLVALVLLVIFVVESIGGHVQKSQQLYPIPGIATIFIVLGIWSVLVTVLWNSRSTATRVGKYVLAVLVTVVVFPLLVTIVSGVAEYIIALDPSRVH
jgi:hypothetical protein